jgi:alkanesulfonate monooxygenase SsuD/methylene tetrahydromethanopterin reductase-like flavin-dependent oxidoreductase (luciferase family)
VAECTRRIRLGTAVVTLPLEGPIRVAEDAAVLDALSGGRVELGVGSGADPATSAFGSEGRTDDVQAPWAEAYLAAYPGPADQVRIGLSRGVYPAADERSAKAAIEAPVLRMAERMVRAGRFPAGLSPEEYFERMHISYGSADEVAERLAGDRVLPLATDLIVQFSPAAPPLDAAITALELLATRVAPTLGWKPAGVDAGAGFS